MKSTLEDSIYKGVKRLLLYLYETSIYRTGTGVSLNLSFDPKLGSVRLGFRYKNGGCNMV